MVRMVPHSELQGTHPDRAVKALSTSLSFFYWTLATISLLLITDNLILNFLTHSFTLKTSTLALATFMKTHRHYFLSEAAPFSLMQDPHSASCRLTIQPHTETNYFDLFFTFFLTIYSCYKSITETQHLQSIIIIIITKYYIHRN